VIQGGSTQTYSYCFTSASEVTTLWRYTDMFIIIIIIIITWVLTAEAVEIVVSDIRRRLCYITVTQLCNFIGVVT